MKNIIAMASCALFLFSCQNQAQPKKSDNNMSAENVVKETIYQYKVEDLSGDTFDFASLKGKKIMIVNTASKCGNTPQYKDLEATYKEYKDKGFVIVGFPANNFMSQEPGTNQEIAAFCQKNYGVTFPMMDKVSVKGDDMCPIYQFLTQKSKNGLQDSKVDWNFQKYLINEKGELEKVISPRTSITDPEVMNWIKA
ncbi:glutathione peroxidase [Flavobacterium micromati]|jgi:glutathione peroxidase|uniref:Glutathione peroxidase n=1 Tax=Flavobacterium micromati TaxID=229205 RepID=A0A1M5HZ57_9FLAO|nr:glutathione peroxidase [Flavobacterium micromati]MCL6462690.1 glutathione peroxidase [Flavobacterium micromati]SHG21083.1 glutathione peroxidase [Flavobacterium micromati]